MIIAIFGTDGAEKARLDLEFGPNVWRLHGAAAAWSGPKNGRFAPDLSDAQTIHLGTGLQPGKTVTGAFLRLSYVDWVETPKSSAGSGTFLDPSGAETDTRVMWARINAAPLSPARRWMIDFLTRLVPKGGLGSRSGKDHHGNDVPNPDWATLTNGWTHAMVKAQFASNPNFTSCNSVAGGVIQNLVIAQGLAPRSRLKSGLIQLDETDQDVKGSWVPAQAGWFPRPGDLYSTSGRSGKQKFGHTGIVISVQNGMLETIDGGQDWRPHMGIVKWKNRPYASVAINGWADLDIWSYLRPVHRMPEVPI